RVPERLRHKCHAIFQSAAAPIRQAAPLKGMFEVCVIGHLREVKDPFRAAEASRLLPNDSRVRITHVGGALDLQMAQRAKREEAENPLYRWLGDLPQWKTLRIVARSRMLIVSSLLEGGANVVSEGIAAGVPVLAS